MDPQWFFTCKELQEYLPFAMQAGRFEVGRVGAKLEAFCIADCSALSYLDSLLPKDMLKTSKQKADFLKKQIRSEISRKLATITENESAVMQYAKYETDVVHKYGVELIGPWPGSEKKQPSNPTKWSTSLPPLKVILEDLEANRIKFEKLSTEETKLRITKYHDQIRDGSIVLRKKGRKETKKSKATVDEGEDEEGEGEGEGDGEQDIRGGGNDDDNGDDAEFNRSANSQISSGDAKEREPDAPPAQDVFNSSSEGEDGTSRPAELRRSARHVEKPLAETGNVPPRKNAAKKRVRRDDNGDNEGGAKRPRKA
ncbi:hypothetical protein BDZ89DRAFT_1051133 [Hymenopellis radicata]|nr:hypothetical protein BDZ89DRAFT_1051133 [Hymenopellis radicata]